MMRDTTNYSLTTTAKLSRSYPDVSRSYLSAVTIEVKCCHILMGGEGTFNLSFRETFFRRIV